MADERGVLGRAITAGALMVSAIMCARGYVPGHETVSPAISIDNSATLPVIATLLGVSLTVVAIAVVTRVQDRRSDPAGIAGRDQWFRAGGAGTRPKRRWWLWLLMALGALAGCMAISVVLLQLMGSSQVDLPSWGTPTSVPTPPDSATAPPIQRPPTQLGSSLQTYLYAATAGFLVVLVAGTLVAQHHRRRRLVKPSPTARSTGGQPPADVAPTESLLRATELGLAEIGDLSRGPREAIISCYATLEQELARVPDAAPQDFDTASEVLDRAVGHSALRADSATRLVHLFAEARFSRHSMDEDDLHHAEAALRRVVDGLRGNT